MRCFLLYVIAILAPALFWGCSSDTPSEVTADTFSFQLIIRNVAPDFVNTTLSYATDNQSDKLLALNGDDEPVMLTSPLFAATSSHWLFDISQNIIDESDIEDKAYVAGIRFTIVVSFYSADGELVSTKEFEFDNVHTIGPSFVTTLFPRNYGFYLYRDDNGSYTLFRKV